MSKNSVLFCSGSAGGKVKLLATHATRPWVISYSELDHSVSVVDFYTKGRLMHKTLQAIVEAAPLSPSSQSALFSSHTFPRNEVADLLFPDGLAAGLSDASDAGGNGTGVGGGAAGQDEVDIAALLSEIGDIRHLAFTDESLKPSFQQSSISSVHVEGFVLIQTTNYIFFYNFLTNNTLFLSNLGSIVWRGRKYLGVAAGGRYSGNSGGAGGGGSGGGGGKARSSSSVGGSNSSNSSSSSSSNSSSNSVSSRDSGFNPNCCAFLDAGVLAVGCSDGTVRVWRIFNDPLRCKETIQWQAYKVEVACLSCLCQPGFDSTGSWLVSISSEGVGYVWFATRSSVPGGELAWQTLHHQDGNFGSLEQSPIAPIARFFTPVTPVLSTFPLYSSSSATLSVALADKTIYSLSLASLFVHSSTSSEEGRGRASTADSDVGKRRSFSEDKQQHAGAGAIEKKRNTLLGGMIGKSFFNFIGTTNQSSSSSLSSSVLFLAEEGGLWVPQELTHCVHHKHQKARNNCIFALPGVRGEILLASKGSGVLLVTCSSLGHDASTPGSSPTVLAAAPIVTEELSMREECNLHMAVSAFLGLDTSEDDDTAAAPGFGNAAATATATAGASNAAATTAATVAASHQSAGTASTEKGMKVYTAALGCGPHLVLGTNKGVVATTYHTARLPAMLASHSTWPFVIVAAPVYNFGASCGCRLSKISHSTGTGQGEGDQDSNGVLVLSATQLGNLVVEETGHEDALAAQLFPSVSGKYCCLLLPPAPQSKTFPATSTFVIFSVGDSLQDVERGTCTSFAWVGARDKYIVTTAVAVAATSTNKRSSLLSSVKGFLARDKTAGKGGAGEQALLARDCLVKAVAAHGGSAAESVTFATGTPLSAATGGSSSSGSGSGSESIAAFSGPVVFLSSNAAPTAPRNATHGSFYHLSSHNGAALEPVSPPMHPPLDVQWNPSVAAVPGSDAGEVGTGALGACLLHTGAVLVLGLTTSAADVLSLACLFLIPFSSPAHPIGGHHLPRIHWATSTGSTNAASQHHTVDLLHLVTPAASFAVPVPKQRGGNFAVLSDSMHALPRLHISGDLPATYAAHGLLIFLTSPPVALRVVEHAPAICHVAALQLGVRGSGSDA